MSQSNSFHDKHFHVKMDIHRSVHDSFMLKTLTKKKLFPVQRIRHFKAQQPASISFEPSLMSLKWINRDIKRHFTFILKNKIK